MSDHEANRNMRAVSNDKNVVSISSLDYSMVASHVMSAMHSVTKKKGYTEVIVDLSKVGRHFPNGCAPVAAILDHYRRAGVDVYLADEPANAAVATVERPITATQDAMSGGIDTVNRVWAFDGEQTVYRYVASLMSSISDKIECSSGVLEAMEWCVSEVMDNVLQHSGLGRGFVMAQVHASTHHLAICVADVGAGIFGTLAQTKYRPRTAIDAITLAIKQGVTRDPSNGQGNGLWGLSQIVTGHSGVLRITSGPGSITFRPDGVDTKDKHIFIDKTHYGTVVDFQVDTNRVIDIAQSLGGHRPVNLRLERLENATGEHVIPVKEFSHGTGTRIAGEQMRHTVVNVLNEGASRILLDFTGVSIISSSFADELVGKLVTRFGFFEFQRLFGIQGMNESSQFILHRAVALRMVEGIKSPDA